MELRVWHGPSAFREQHFLPRVRAAFRTPLGRGPQVVTAGGSGSGGGCRWGGGRLVKSYRSSLLRTPGNGPALRGDRSRTPRKCRLVVDAESIEQATTRGRST